MARTREYDRDDVLGKAVDLFWRQGYKASSVADVVQATGLNTASMYKEFGDKDGLFEEALEYYRRHIIGPRTQILIDHPNLAGVELFLENVINGAKSGKYKGCLMMNHLAQQHSVSRRAARQIGKFCGTMESLLAAALENAQMDGDVPADKDSTTLASFIMCSVHGLVLYGRHANKKSNIPNLYDLIIQTIRG
jgi:TetR/AcrR family transcriptional regulator, transcriptional repressor for nem operon